MPGLADKIDHIVVLMLENRSFDCLCGRLYPDRADFAGLSGEEWNPYTQSDGTVERIGVWNDAGLAPGGMTIPDPDPGELYTPDMAMQLFGLGGSPSQRAPPMSGFVDSYMRQPPAHKPYDPHAPMHYFTPEQLPVLATLARSFAVCDQWHASAPSQTWPNRFFVHTASAGGWVNNAPPHFPYLMPTIFRLLEDAGLTTRIYFHDFPQSMTLAGLWRGAAQRFRPFEEFLRDTAGGTLPAYAFIEPRYFTDPVLRLVPNDQHPPHAVVYGEQLIATVYNALRASPQWRRVLFVLTYDEHGGCYDHMPPPLAPPPGPAGFAPDGFPFDRYGVRVPAVVVSPYVAPGTILRSAPAGLPHQGPPYPFDHASIIRTVRERFAPAASPLSGRDTLAPSLDAALTLPSPDNAGPDRIAPPEHAASTEEIAYLQALPPNDLQQSLARAAVRLPQFGADIEAHIAALAAGTLVLPELAQREAAAALAFAKGRLNAFLGNA